MLLFRSPLGTGSSLLRRRLIFLTFTVTQLPRKPQRLSAGMTNFPNIEATELTPILYVKDFREAMNYYTEKLLFRCLWECGKEPTFGAVGLGKIKIFLSEGGQGKPGTWMSIFMDDVDSYLERIKPLGADVIYGPTDEPWGCREMHVRDPNEHVLRFSHYIPMREPKMEIERVAFDTRIEKRLAALLLDLARHKNMTPGEMLEETFLHTFEKVKSDGVASPHAERTFTVIEQLKRKHGIDYETHASYRFVEKIPERGT